jgi:glycosyltransferase involved in cell wall biosynthesis
MKIAVFISHPIQYFTPLWQAIGSSAGVELKVFYFSSHGLVQSYDRGFGTHMAWDMDLLGGYDSEFLPRQWPTTDPLDYTTSGLNRGIVKALRENWDVVFVSGYGHANNWLIVAACKVMGIPVMCYGDSTLTAEREKPLWRRLVKRAILSPFFDGVAAFLGAGGQTRAYFVEYGAPPQSVFVCPYVVDVVGFRSAVARAGESGAHSLRRRFDLPTGKRVIGFCGKLVPWKRPLDLVAAIHRLRRDDIVALFIGEGPLRDEVARQGGELARITGFVNRSELPLALSLLDLLVLPSAFEPYGIVVAEAQVLGVPCIVSDRTGCHGLGSVLQDGVSGFVYECGAVDRLAEQIAALLDSPVLYEAMSAAALKRGELQSQQHARSEFLRAAHYSVKGSS